jgi:hypothetical protein
MATSIDLVAMESQLGILTRNWFNLITGVPQYIRPDDKKRTGISVFVREVNTRNQIRFSVYEPSKDAEIFSIEKGIRSALYEEYSSGNSANPDKMQFAGSFTVMINDVLLQVSVSGLKAEEDAAISLVTLAYICKTSPMAIYRSIFESKGELPAAFSDEIHYLYPYVRYEKIQELEPDF